MPRSGALLTLSLTIFVGTTSSLTRPAHAATSTVRLKPLVVHDPMVGGDEAFRLLIPVGWQSEGGVHWQHDRSNLATIAMRVFNPQGAEALEVFPQIPYVWNETGIPFFPPGSVYLGNEVQPVPRDAAAYVEQVVLPRHRGKVRGLRVVSRTPLPDVAEAAAKAAREPGVNKTAHGAKVRISYIAAGRGLEEDIYCVLLYATAPILPGTTMWVPERLFGFRAAKGELDGLASVLQAMVSSVKPNLAWFNKYLQVVQLQRQGQAQAIRNAGELSRYIARTNDEISATIRQSYESQQATYDRINDRFSRHIRDVETYQNTFEGRPVNLPTGYRDAWVSSSGEYVLSNDANFNPNVGSTVEWRRMEARE
jgi:hypothetical protein